VARNSLEQEDIQLFESWSIDLIGILPLTMNGNRHIITAIERSTSWPVVHALKDGTSKSVTNFINDEIFSVYGIPNEILTDNGSNLVSEETTSFLAAACVKHRLTTLYHPQINGKIERFNGILSKMLTQYCYGKQTVLWDKYLMQAVFAVRIRVRSVSKFSPFFLLFGVDPRISVDKNVDRAADTNEDEIDSELDPRLQALINRYGAVNNARMIANKELVQKAVRTALRS
jgi:transposase InsO family protein